jgi:hypothetical protein
MFETWAPPDDAWSLWTRPILFAQMAQAKWESAEGEPWRSLDLSWAPAPGAGAAVVVDLPGEEAVWTGLALAGRGYRPVPLFNACTGPGEVVSQGRIMAALRAGAAYLAGLPLTGAPPAFLLDAQRAGPPGYRARPLDFDNRYAIFPQDFPSATFLQGRGIRQVVLAVRGGPQVREDLAHVLRRWQDAGLALHVKDLASAAPPSPLRVDRPPWYRWAWQRLQTILGLRRCPQGGFGAQVPRPSSHG